MNQPKNAFNVDQQRQNRLASSEAFASSAGLATAQLRRGLALSVELVSELAVDIDHLCTARSIKLIFRSTCGALNDGDACTFGQRNLHRIFVADGAGEHGW